MLRSHRLSGYLVAKRQANTWIEMASLRFHCVLWDWALATLFRVRKERVPSEWMKLKPMPRKCAAHITSRSDEPIHSVRKLGSLVSSVFWRTTALSARWPCSGLPWRWRERGIRVRFRRGSLRNGYHFYGGQQARKLPNAEKRVRQ